MSFILDALKKSEAERNRQAGPTLYEMRAAPRRAPLPTWVIVIGVVLGLNLAGLGYLLLRRPVAAPAPAMPAAPAATPPAAAAPAPAAAPALEPLSIRTEAAIRSEPEPAATPPVAASTVAPSSAPRPTLRPAEGHVASLAEMAASGANLPELRLALHAYDADGTRRFILLNGLRLREGEATPDGLQVERIVEDGAVLSWRGRRFMLPRGE